MTTSASPQPTPGRALTAVLTAITLVLGAPAAALAVARDPGAVTVTAGAQTATATAGAETATAGAETGTAGAEPAAPPEPAEPGDVIPGRYIVTVEPGSDPDAVAAGVRGLGVASGYTFDEAVEGFVATMPPEAAQRLEQDGRVAAVEPDRVIGLDATQSPAAWGLDRIDERALPLEGRYDYRVDGSGVRVYVLDTGIRSTHAEFGGRVTAGFNAFPTGSDEDCHGHGTHVAGTIGGTTSGVAKRVQLVPVRVLDCAGAGSSSTAIAGIDWMIAHHPPGTPAVANLSLGGGLSDAFDAAVRRAVAAGITVVVSAGNKGADACSQSPARVAEAVTVGSTDQADRRASSSNVGPCLDVFAPGVRIPSAWYTSDTAGALMSGTSMAAPHAAGVAAQLLDATPAASPRVVADALRAQATPGVVTDPGTGSPNRVLYNGLVAPDVTPPAAVTRLAAAPGLGRATLSWTNPTAPDLRTVVVRVARGTTPPSGPTAGAAVANRLAATATATGLRSGTDHSFSVFAVDATGNVSARASVTLRGTRSTAVTSARTVTSGTPVTVSGRLVASSTSAGLGGHPVDVLVRRRGAVSWTRVTTVTTSSTGYVAARHVPQWNADYALRFAGRGAYLGAVSTAAPVDVATRVTATLSTTSVTAGRAATLTGTVGPNHAGQRVTLQRQVGGVWRDDRTTTLSSSSTYRFTLLTTTKGTHAYRVVKPADADHVRGFSPVRTVRVR